MSMFCKSHLLRAATGSASLILFLLTEGASLVVDSVLKKVTLLGSPASDCLVCPCLWCGCCSARRRSCCGRPSLSFSVRKWSSRSNIGIALCCSPPMTNSLCHIEKISALLQPNICFEHHNVETVQIRECSQYPSLITFDASQPFFCCLGWSTCFRDPVLPPAPVLTVVLRGFVDQCPHALVQALCVIAFFGRFSIGLCEDYCERTISIHNALHSFPRH